VNFGTHNYQYPQGILARPNSATLRVPYPMSRYSESSLKTVQKRTSFDGLRKMAPDGKSSELRPVGSTTEPSVNRLLQTTKQLPVLAINVLSNAPPDLLPRCFLLVIRFPANADLSSPQVELSWGRPIVTWSSSMLGALPQSAERSSSTRMN
jgi:hypothetical protein